MFGLSLVASVVIITLIWNRLVRDGIGPSAMVPTLWIVLGPVGQSVTAAGLLGTAAGGVLTGPDREVAAGFAVLYGVCAFGFAALWFTLAGAVTVRAARDHLPFSLTWWSFTFPVGTCVTGASGLAARTGADLFRGTAAALFGFLIAAWLTVTVRTLLGTWNGRLLLAPAPVAARG